MDESEKQGNDGKKKEVNPASNYSTFHFFKLEETEQTAILII
jgi:hypothetical protein